MPIVQGKGSASLPIHIPCVNVNQNIVNKIVICVNMCFIAVLRHQYRSHMINHRADGRLSVYFLHVVMGSGKDKSTHGGLYSGLSLSE